MANFYLDNQDIQFLFDHLDVQELAEVQELCAENGDADFVPADVAETVDGGAKIEYYRSSARGASPEPSGVAGA